MKIIDNTSQLLGDDLKSTLGRGSRLKVAASCFSIYAFEALKSELSKVDLPDVRSDRGDRPSSQRAARIFHP